MQNKIKKNKSETNLLFQILHLPSTKNKKVQQIKVPTKQATVQNKKKVFKKKKNA